MKTRVLSIFLILLLCLTAGCGKASQNTESPTGFLFRRARQKKLPEKIPLRQNRQPRLSHPKHKAHRQQMRKRKEARKANADRFPNIQ